ncbi:Ppx/GppA phosphatase family protein, partial [Streptomyces sp. wa1071]|uniref:Ppx/GppA phosphatase family protein n=1 Tax=Streptomyces sp. wa1071 TaxID=1828217 RepID=UPI003F8F5747
MRLGVLDVGSNTVHLLVVDAHPGARPLPAHSHKAELRLAELLDEGGAIGPLGVDRLVATIAGAVQAAEDKGCEDVLAFATSAVREATNADLVLERVRVETGVDLAVLSGEEEARLTFLAARRWFGWSAGKLLVLDIGGGSLEIAFGIDEEPDTAVSLPLGAGRLTGAWLPDDPAGPDQVRALRRHCLL